MIRLMLSGVAALALAACTQEPAGQAAAPSSSAPATETAPSAQQRLETALAAQPDETKARYAWRHPKETLQFFGVEPGMTVVEALPGGGWYSKILLSYLGEKGALIGADYAVDMWPLFGSIFSPEFLEARKSWVADWTAEAGGWCETDCASVSAFQFGSMPDNMAGGADAVLFIRALHNLSRFEDQGGYLTQAIDDAKTVLKPGGVVGVVQHRGPEENPDEWARGGAGYLKQSAVIAMFEAAGFDYLGASEVNANPNDRPTADDIVWRLPPSLATSRDNPELRAQMEAIGESDRMTLKFRKPK